MLIKCENCGATLSYDADLKSIKCEYCGTVCSLELLRLSMGQATDSAKSPNANPLDSMVQAPEPQDANRTEELYIEEPFKTEENPLPEASPQPEDMPQPEAPQTNSKLTTSIVCFLLILFILCLVVASFDASPTGKSPSSAVATEQTVQYLPIDYRELMADPKKYDNTYVRVAGCTLGKKYNDYVFHEGVDSLFKMEVKGDEEIPAGTYMVVEGLFEATYSTMDKCQVVEIGEAAQQEAKLYEDAWNAKRLSETENLPILYYMDLFNVGNEKYDGQLVRIAGTIEHDYINVLKSQLVRGVTLEWEIDSLAYADRELCEYGTDFVISGIASVVDGKVFLKYCYAEKIGDEAAEIVASVRQDWWETYETIETGYIAHSTPRSYEDLARYPEKLKGELVAVTGTVVSNDDMDNHDRIILDMVGDGVSTVYVYYTGRTDIDEPLLLPGDKVTFYGDFDGLVNYAVNAFETSKALLVFSFCMRQL